MGFVNPKRAFWEHFVSIFSLLMLARSRSDEFKLVLKFIIAYQVMKMKILISADRKILQIKKVRSSAFRRSLRDTYCLGT
ncbi:Uncharacterized protein dnm_080250 [Desulfonema magnum]|uniref:Uncharacterized protein n=1 Tax=Desulfonema magnum TaxID=45655 RepID=A0A975BUW9_9BACT|nr:Uncharacterized protein dnm_080250 [Desulfonema magnum]